MRETTCVLPWEERNHQHKLTIMVPIQGKILQMKRLLSGKVFSQPNNNSNKLNQLHHQPYNRHNHQQLRGKDHSSHLQAEMIGQQTPADAAAQAKLEKVAEGIEH
jgi:hypothetical protein